MTRNAFEKADACADGSPPDPELWAWVCQAFRGHRRHGRDLEAAFDMDHAGKLRWRNVELRAAAEALRAGREMSDNDLAGELAARLQRFTVDKLPRYWRTGDVSGFDAVEHRLLAAALTGAPTTSSKKNLYRIIEREPGQESALLVQADS
ncbi:MAG TPA: hypothetical protein VMV78_07855 [Thiobacillus sp.]|nr:hypothetical protein [Thiobacillus sp.]